MKRFAILAATLAAAVLATLILVALPAAPAQAGGDCASAPFSSPCLHVRSEGVLLPLTPAQTADWNLDTFLVTASPVFFETAVRNFEVNVYAEFDISPVAGNAGGRIDLAFPLTPHALYGPDNEMRDLRITVDGDDVPFDVLVNRDALKLRDDGRVWYRRRVINEEVHPLLAAASDMRKVAPQYVADGFDVLVAFHPMIVGGRSRVIVQYSTNSDDRSLCCLGVSAPAASDAPYTFRFDLTNTRYWNGDRNGFVRLLDGPSALWASVPDRGQAHETVPGAYIMETHGTVADDLALPVQPSLFHVTPREWPDGIGYGAPVTFEIERTALDADTDVRIEEVVATPGLLHVDAALPIVLTAAEPRAYFTARFNDLTVAPVSWIDVRGFAVRDGQPSAAWRSEVRIPVLGPAVTGHDLAVSGLTVVPDASAAGAPDHHVFRARVANRGWMNEEILATLYVNRKFVKSYAFGPLFPMEEREIVMHGVVPWRLPCIVEVEIEPAATELSRANNRAACLVPRSIDWRN